MSTLGRYYISLAPDSASATPLYVTLYPLQDAQPVLHAFVPDNETQHWDLRGDAGNNIRAFRTPSFGNWIGEDRSDPAATQGKASAVNWGIAAVGDAWRVSLDADDSGPYWYVREAFPHPLLGLDASSFSLFRFVELGVASTYVPDPISVSSTTSDSTSTPDATSTSSTSPGRTTSDPPSSLTRNPGPNTNPTNTGNPAPTTTNSASRVSKASFLTLSLLASCAGLVMTL